MLMLLYFNSNDATEMLDWLFANFDFPIDSWPVSVVALSTTARPRAFSPAFLFSLPGLLRFDCALRLAFSAPV
jgi:hypothetical protein